MDKKLNFVFLGILLFLITPELSWSQSEQYKRPKSNSEKAKNPIKNSSQKGSSNKDVSNKSKDDQKYKVDLSNIEQKYWAPKDTEFSVVQSRTYSKAHRFSLSLQGGVMINDPYNEGFSYGGTLNYFFNERNGVEFHFVTSSLKDNQTVRAFLNDVGTTGGVKPDYSRPNKFYGFSYNWVPIYAKMSLLDTKILYFDFAISPGLGMLTYEQQSEKGNQEKTTVALTLDLTQYFFLTKNFAIRADYKNKWFKEDIITYKNATYLRSQTTNSSQFLIGVTYYF